MSDLFEDSDLKGVVAEWRSEEVRHAPGKVGVDEDQVDSIDLFPATIGEGCSPNFVR